MKALFLVGESLPKKDATPSGTHGKDLAAIDARHGVFPNLVGKPLLSALYWLHANRHSATELLDQLELLMIDKSKERRFNVFKTKSSKETFAFESKISKRLDSLDPKTELWLTFGVQTNFGLLGLMLGRFKRTEAYSKKDILDFSHDFLRVALSHRPLASGFPIRVPTQRTSRLGILHRLYCHADQRNDDLHRMLRAAVKTVPLKHGEKATERDESEVDEIIAKLHGMIPLLHNEAYQDRYEIGYNQAHFVLGTSVRKWSGDPPQLYWSVMGEAIGRRLLNQFVDNH